MSYDDTPDVVFNPQDEPLPAPSDFFAHLSLVPRYYDLPHGDPRFDQEHGQQVNDPMQIDGTPPPDAGFLAQSHRARVAHLPQPTPGQQPAAPEAEEAAGGEAMDFEIPPLFPNWSERDIAAAILTPEAFSWWAAKDELAKRGQLPDIPQVYPAGHPNNRPTESLATDGRIIEWEDLHLGVRWLLILRLSEQHTFTVAIVSQLKLSNHQLHDFITSYVNHCEEWNEFELTVSSRAKGLELWDEEAERALLNWLHEKRPLLPYDSLTSEDVQLGIRFLYERCIVDGGVDLVAWFEEKDKKDFARIPIGSPIMRDCLDHRILRRAAAAKLLPIKKIEEAIKDLGRQKRLRAQSAMMNNSMRSDAFLGTRQARVPWEANPFEPADVEMSVEAQTVMDTILTGATSDEPMQTPMPFHQRQQMSEEAHHTLRRIVPELQPIIATGGLARTQWEIDNGYPYGFNWEYTPLHWGDHADAMETDPIPEELVNPQPSRVAALRETLTQRQGARAAAASSSAQSSADDSAGQEAERGQLMVGIVSDMSLAAGQDPQNPGLATQLAEEGFPGQPEVPIGAVEGEPVSSLPTLDPTEILEPGDNVVAPKQRSRRARRPSARALESLQLALELEHNAETIPEKPKERKTGRASRKEQQGAQDEGPQSAQDAQSAQDSPEEDGIAEVARDAPVAHGGPEPAKEVGDQEAAAAAAGAAAPTAPIVVPRMRGSLVRPKATARTVVSLPTVDEVPTETEDGQPEPAVGEPGASGSGVTAAPDPQRISAAKRRSEKIFGISRTQELNSCPSPVPETCSAWSAEVAQFAVEALQASYALTADRIAPGLKVAPQYEMDEDTIKATITSMEAQYTCFESMSQSENGPAAQKAEFAGVTDVATFSVHAAEAAFAFEEEKAVEGSEEASGPEEQQTRPEE
ncbi:hypothetical protein MKX07_003150 [Trichoderma sp. CBMAI-0711]|nr:hypothetical protein MKX07_003150 [Trichoderma sp. CBMAI-0711]